MCHPIGYGFERLGAKIEYMYRISSDNNWGRFFFFFPRRRREGFTYFLQKAGGAGGAGGAGLLKGCDYRGTAIIRGNDH